MTRQQFSALVLLLGSCLITLLYFVFAYSGHFGFDDMQYAEIAHGILNGQIDYGDHFYYRTPVVYLTAAAYAIFGINDFASALPTLLMMFFLLWLVYRTLSPRGNYALAAGLSLTVLNGWLIFYSSKLMPDIFLAVGALASLVVVHQYKFRPRRYPTIVYALLFALSLLFGFMAKGVIVLLLPLLAYLFLLDIIKGRGRQFWWSAALASLAAFGVYFLITGLVTGDPWMRFRAINANSYLNACSYDVQPLAVVMRRITYQFFELMLREGMFVGLLLAAALLFEKNKGRHFSFNSPPAFWAISAIILLFSANFMSVSPSGYAPLCLDPRHYLLLVPVAAIAGGYVVDEFLNEQKHTAALLSLFFLAAGFNFLWQKQIIGTEYFWLLLLFGGYTYFKPGKSFHVGFLVCFALILAGRNYSNTVYFRSIQYQAQQDFVFENLIEPDQPMTVLTDPVLARLGRYYNGFDDRAKVKFLSYLDVTPGDLSASDQPRLLKNWHTQFQSELANDDLPVFVREPNSNRMQLLAEQAATNTALYRVQASITTDQANDPLLVSKNSFAASPPYWLTDTTLIQSQVTYDADQRALRTGEFAGTLVYPIDSLQLGPNGSLLIQADVMAYFSASTAAVLCISIEDADGVYHYFAKPVDKSIKAYANWWPVSYAEQVALDKIKPASLLKVYLWNPEREEGFIDAFSVKIQRLE